MRENGRIKIRRRLKSAAQPGGLSFDSQIGQQAPIGGDYASVEVRRFFFGKESRDPGDFVRVGKSTGRDPAGELGGIEAGGHFGRDESGTHCVGGDSEAPPLGGDRAA